MQPNNFFSLEQIIDRQPITVSPNTPLSTVISLMQERGNSCSIIDGELDPLAASNNSCVLVVEGGKLNGIFTERDLVKLVATEADTQRVTVGEMMTENIVTLSFTGNEDLFSALGLLKKYDIRHLPIVDQDERLFGLVTIKNIRQKLQPVNLMRWRSVGEIMNPDVVHAHPDDTVRHLAWLMAENNASCVALAETKDDSESQVYPLGIITERDIVQFQNLNLDFAQPARNLMSTPLFLVRPADSLWSVHQQMQQRRIRRLLVGGAQGELVGIITQASLLQIFDPTEMYGVIEALQQQVCELETEREALLKERNSELEQEVEESAAAIKTQNIELQNNRAELRQANQELFFHVNN